ncbi:ATPase [Formosa agariphila KMM 3901]|uniref:ATPase n=1 Tax=Formosa agariphila (strain DSM 15362 / KCTC 12365 / LMG 23005 / KMM 3901 / M-2Alg 35-1) TaxID=1347342 RepID=T2KP99_FORAG|nr:ATPase [Formosa agariphila]CDF80293.1 ATPase [Formosa agariphila KMM 3901]
MTNLYKITEGDVEYTLGKMNGQMISYDFKKILEYLEAKGKLMFGQQFKIYKQDHDLILKLSCYFIKDESYCEARGIDLNKGILLSGPVGSGKTSLMKLIRNLSLNKRKIEVVPTRNIVFAYNHLGTKTIEDFGNRHCYCFDDLGIEPMGKYYGNTYNVMGEILLSRYELFLETNIKTHLTTNLNAVEIEERYGTRVRSRMRHLFNLITFDKDTTDKRI